MSMIRSTAAYVFLLLSFGGTLLCATLGRIVPRRRRCETGRILITGRFDNLNWFISHATPLVRSGAREVIVVTEVEQEQMEGLRFVCPPRWAQKILGRAISKLIWMIAAGVRFKPDVYIGYHLFPGALSVLCVARWLGRPACYQMTGGPIEIAGGGFENENALMNSLAGPSRLLEQLALAVVRQFDLVVVRGRRAERFLTDRGLNGSVAIVTGSVAPVQVTHHGERPVDLIFVGRLTRIKQPEQFVRIVAAVKRDIPEVRAMMIGQGPEMHALRRSAERLGVTSNIEFTGRRHDVSSLLERAKVFVLVSRSEGMSIAMAEAMSRGLPVVVADVGELSDLVRNGVNGWLVTPKDIETYARRIVALLTNEADWTRYSRSAADSALSLMSVDRVAGRWRECLGRIVGRPPASREQGETHASSAP